MRLWVDGQCLQTASRMRGIGRYVGELLRAIAEHHPKVDLSISFNAAMPDQALLAREAVSGIIRPENVHVWHGAAKAGEAIDGYTPERRLSELALSHHVNCLAPDVALSASPFEGAGDLAVPLLPGRGCTVPTAAIFYDAIPHRFKAQYILSADFARYYMRRLNSHAEFQHNLAISDFSKSELISIFGKSNATNISAGVSSDFLSRVSGLARDEKPAKHNKFVLYVGAFDWRKNIGCVVDAFALANGQELDSLSFVMAGDAPRELLNQVCEAWAQRGLSPERLVYLGHVSDEELTDLYLQAEVLVQPSFMEGFGLTALEAIHCGTPVLAARAGALPEVIGCDGLLFDPTNPSELADLLVRVIRRTPEIESFMAQAKQSAERFTWKRSASVAIDCLGNLAKTRNKSTTAENRRWVAGMIDFGPLNRDDAARSLALSEVSEGASRLLVDVTATAEMDHATGIQRVVRQICGHLGKSDRGRQVGTLFIASETGEEWRSIKDFAARAKMVNGARMVDGAPRVMLGRDHLLMLDSSWHLFAQHEKALRACRLRGGDVTSCLYDTVPIFSQAMCNPTVPPVFTQWFQRSLKYSTGFVCISKAVADELLSLLEAIRFPRPMKVGYWQLGADFAAQPPSSLQQAADAKERRPCFLMVGTLEPRKGHRVALDAFDSLWADGADIELVIVGKVGWGISHLVERIRRHAEFGSRLHWHENADDGELSALYDQCDALIAASFAEGFGLPIVEAGHYGKQAIASDIPVFREIGKGAAAAHFFKVGDASALAKTVSRFLKNKAGSVRPLKKSAWPSWAESAAQLEEVVLGQQWYKTYEPLSSRLFTPLSDLGVTRVTEVLNEESQRAHRLELVEGPYVTDDGAASKIIVKMTNLSEIVWSSQGETDGRLGIALSYHTLGAAGESLSYDNARTHIPFVMAPGDTHYMAVNVPMSLIEHGAEFVDIELVQEGVRWFGSPLRVAL